MNRVISRLGSFRNDRRGSISIEFAVLAAMLIGVLFSSIEYGRYIITTQKVDKTVASVGDMITQYTELQTQDVKDIFTAAGQILPHYVFKGRGVMIVSHIHAAKAGQPAITWQVFSSSSKTDPSKLGKAGETPKLPAGFSMTAGETVIAVEAYVKFEPMLFDLVVSGQDIYKIAWYHPRKAEQIAYTNTGSPAVDVKDCSNHQGTSSACGSQN